jgi:Fe-S oxidoreductase
MTTTYDPHHPLYTDEADVRLEMARVFDVCGQCRLCAERCGSFTRLIDLVERDGGRSAEMMTPAEQDGITDACHQCNLCTETCPNTPRRNPETSVDVPRLMLRATAMQFANKHRTPRSLVATNAMGRTALVGRIASTVAPLANGVIAAPPDSLIRRLGQTLSGVSAHRRLPDYAAERFSAWFRKRPKVTLRKKQATATVFPTCIVEFQATEIGKDLVKVYERNGVECAVSGAGCCGAPWLHAGDIERFGEIAAENVATLAAEIRAGTNVVVPQAACSHTIRCEYPVHAPGPDADLVAANTYDASSYLMSLHRSDDYVLDMNFDRTLFPNVLLHAPTLLRAQQIGYPSRDLLKLTGALVNLAHQPSGVESRWGYRSANDDDASVLAEALGARIESSSALVIGGDCHLSNTVIAEQTGIRVRHPLQIVARAYGIHEE